MTETKPIDWTRPLQAIASKEAVAIIDIKPAHAFPVGIRNLASGDEYRVDRRGHLAGSDVPHVENVPAEPRIVERFGLAYFRHDEYFVVGQLFNDRASLPERAPGCRVARILIEEPGDG